MCVSIAPARCACTSSDAPSRAEIFDYSVDILFRVNINLTSYNNAITKGPRRIYALPVNSVYSETSKLHGTVVLDRFLFRYANFLASSEKKYHSYYATDTVLGDTVWPVRPRLKVVLVECSLFRETRRISTQQRDGVVSRWTAH